jgi:hypothetical protein
MNFEIRWKCFQLMSFQHSNLLRENSPFRPHDPSVPVLGCLESITKHASSNSVAVCDVDARSFGHKQVSKLA